MKAKKEAEAEPVVKKAAFFASEQRELDAAFAEDDAEAVIVIYALIARIQICSVRIGEIYF